MLRARSSGVADGEIATSVIDGLTFHSPPFQNPVSGWAATVPQVQPRKGFMVKAVERA